MEQTKKQEYETPQVEMLNARVEKGFAGSGMAKALMEMISTSY